MEILFGETNLDGTVSLMESWELKSRLYKRNVRKYGAGVFIYYTPFDENLKDNYLLFSIHTPDKLQVYWKEDPGEDLRLDLQKKFLWASNLLDEIMDQKAR
jgi:hypothetical protein